MKLENNKKWGILYICLFVKSTDIYKIGFTKNIDKRIKQLNKEYREFGPISKIYTRYGFIEEEQELIKFFTKLGYQFIYPHSKELFYQSSLSDLLIQLFQREEQINLLKELEDYLTNY